MFVQLLVQACTIVEQRLHKRIIATDCGNATIRIPSAIIHLVWRCVVCEQQLHMHASGTPSLQSLRTAGMMLTHPSCLKQHPD